MVDVTRDGRFYIKTWNSVKVPADGDPYTIFAKIIPPYVSVERAWVHNFYTGHDDMEMHDKQEIMTTMGMTNSTIDSNDVSVGTQDGVGGAHDDDDQDHLNGYVGGRLPLSQGIYSGTRIDTAQDVTKVGLSGGQPLSKWYKDRMIGTRRFHSMGLGRNAIMSGQGAIRFCVDDYWGEVNVSGHTCSITEPRLIAMQTVTAVTGETGGDPEWLLTGSNDLEVDELTSDAWFLFGEGGVNIDEGQDHVETVASIAAGIPSADNAAYQNLTGASTRFESWASQGWTPNDQNDDTGLDTSTPIIVQSKVTLECRTLKPAQRKIWTPN